MSGTDKQHSKIQWFFFVILIPTIFAIILFLIILLVLGFDLEEKMKQVGTNLPMISDYFIEEEFTEIEIEELLEQISAQEKTIEELQIQLSLTEEELEKLTEETSELENERNQRDEEVREVQTDLKDIAKTYESMSTKSAANILAELDSNEALLHITQVKTDTRAAIIAKMEPKKAAQIMSSLAD